MNFKEFLKTLSYNDQKVELAKVNKKLDGSKEELKKLVKQYEENQDDLTDQEIEDLEDSIEVTNSEIEELEGKKSIATDLIEKKKVKKSKVFTNLQKNANKHTNALKKLLASDELAKAYAKRVLTGDDTDYNKLVEKAKTLAEYKKTLSTASTDGTTANAMGVIIPTYLDNEVRKLEKDVGGLFGFAKITNIVGYERILIEKSRTGAEWHKENDPAVEDQDIVMDSVHLDPEFIKKKQSWTDKLEYMSPFQLLDYLVEEFYEEIVLQADSAIANRDEPTNGLYGIIPLSEATGGDAYVATLYDNGALSWQLAYQARAKIKAKRARKVKCFMNQATFYENIKTISSTTNEPIFNLNEGMPYYGAFEVEFTDALVPYSEATDGDAYMLFGVENTYDINAPRGTTPDYVLDRISMSDSNKNKLVGRLLLAGRVTRLKSWSVIKKGTAPIA